MPFDEEDEDQVSNQKTGLKNVSTQRSIFEQMKKKPTQEDFEKQVKAVEQKMASYKQRAAELAVQFKKIVEDKTLSQNKNIFNTELEREVLSKMIQLASEINNDPNEQEGMGSLSWITLLFKTVLSQRDRINNLEYSISQLDKKIDIDNLSSKIIKQIQSLDKTKKDE
jgi:hypothetical protein